MFSFMAAGLLVGFFLWTLRVRNRKSFAALDPWKLGSTQDLQISDATVFVRRSNSRSGTDRPILFLHGLGASSYCWRDVLPLIPDSKPWIAIDIPGFGRSSKSPVVDYGLDSQTRRVLEVLDALEISAVDIVGSSLGAALGFWLCAHFPKRCRGYIGISPAIAIGGRFSFRASQWLKKIPFIERGIPLLRFLINELFVYFLLTRVRGIVRPMTRPQRIQILSPYLDDGSSMICFFKSLDLIQDSRLEEEWLASPLPLTLIWGRFDRVVPLKNLELLMRGKNNISVTLIENSGHHPMEDDPERICAIILKTFGHTKSLSDSPLSNSTETNQRREIEKLAREF